MDDPSIDGGQADVPSSFDANHVDVHAGYRALRITHEPPDEYASAQVTPRVARPHLVRASLFIFSELLLVAGVVVGGLLSLATVGNAFWTGILGYCIGLIPLVAILWTITLFLPVREPIAEYGVLLEGQGAAQELCFSSIERVVRNRQIPFSPKRIGYGAYRMLAFSNGSEYGTILVARYGLDLYAGWSMWRKRSTVMLILHIMRDWAGPSNADVVATGTTKAFREILHSVTREGISHAIAVATRSGE
jgi:hypothetical protein